MTRIFVIFCMAAALFLMSGCALNALNISGTHSYSSESCAAHQKGHHSGSPDDIDTSLQREYAEFILVAEKALALREEALKLGRNIKTKLDAGRPLTGYDTSAISAGISSYLAIRQQLLAIAESHECWLDLDDKGLAGSGLSQEQRYRGIMLSLASAMILYDNYLIAISMYSGDSRLRRSLNEKDTGYGLLSNELDKITLSYNSVTNRSRVRSAISHFESNSKSYEDLTTSSEVEYVRTLIAQSPSYSMVKEWSPLYVIGSKIGFLQGVGTDTLMGFEKEGFNLFSMVFGNALGLVESRKGLLYGDEAIKSGVSGKLQAGDVLLEKTPFRLTDKLIPGYWGHAAMWIGTEDELQSLGLWDDPLVIPHHDKIRQGRSVVEALRSGVEMNTLDHFLNIDSIGVMRAARLKEEDKKNAILLALRQVGKPYDFNFDVETRDRVYCSKLIYMSYTNVEWPTKKSLGRSTFTPDDVAFKAAYDNVFDLMLFYHEGGQVAEEPLETMGRLMGVQNRRSQAH